MHIYEGNLSFWVTRIEINFNTLFKYIYVITT